MYIEQELRRKGFRYFIGVDEAGRGPLAGPVVASAVFLDNLKSLPRLEESKKLSASKRDFFFRKITKNVKYKVSILGKEVIDRLNIYVVSHHAFRLSLQSLMETLDVDFKKLAIIVDGPAFMFKKGFPNVFCFPKADQRSKACQAASIVAKVVRDRIMEIYSGIYPEYDFHIHKGYATAKHRKKLKEHGPCIIHRMSFDLWGTKEVFDHE